MFTEEYNELKLVSGNQHLSAPHTVESKQILLDIKKE